MREELRLLSRLGVLSDFCFQTVFSRSISVCVPDTFPSVLADLEGGVTKHVALRSKYRSTSGNVRLN